MALSEIDRNLLERCLQRKPRAWEDFVDRFMGLVIHVVNHTARCRNMQIAAADRDDLCADVFLAIVRQDFALLRNFRGSSSLATYLTVVARRIVVRELLTKISKPQQNADDSSHPAHLPQNIPDPHQSVEQRIANREEVEHLLSHLPGNEAEVVRMYHIEGRSYHEISSAVGVPENSIGPILTRARGKLRRVGASS